jgi:hypothetical protein
MKKTKLTLTYVLFLLCLFLSQVVLAQTVKKNYVQNNNACFMYFGDHKFSSKWGLHIESQLRRNEVISKPQQLLLRTGLNYHLNDNAFLTVGYCFVETYPYGDLPVKTRFPENRFWEQIQIKTQVKSIEWINRLRLEQRFSKLPVLDGSTYKPGPHVFTNRFRLLNRFSIPLKGKTITDKSFYISCYDEVFINFGKKVALNVFDQNRAYFALGYKIKNLGKLEMGYMFQSIQKGNGVDIEQNQTLQLGLSSTLDFFKKH